MTDTTFDRPGPPVDKPVRRATWDDNAVTWDSWLWTWTGADLSDVRPDRPDWDLPWIRIWSPVAGWRGPRNGAPVVWGRTAGVWGWLDINLAEVLGNLTQRLDQLRGWFSGLQKQTTILGGRVGMLENQVAELDCKVVSWDGKLIDPEI